jgi:hypothetical protein
VLKAIASRVKRRIAPKPKLFFVFPPDRVRNFKPQCYADANGKKVDKGKHKSVRAIQQFALEINLSGAA